MTDAELWERFQSATLASADWVHHTHLRVAWMYLRAHPLDDAHILMRVGIIRLNATQGLVETPMRGYHETLTRVWLRLVASRAGGYASATAFLEANAAHLGKDVPLVHYTRERLFSAQARACYVEPDLLPLP